MARLPPWVFILVGALVIFFGIFRIALALRTVKEQERTQTVGGLFGYKRRTSLLIGIIYIILGILLVLPAVGVNMHLPWQR